MKLQYHFFSAAIVALSTAVNAQDPVPAGAGPETVKSRRILIERGRYLITTNGCNECHTPRYAPREGKVPENELMTGSGNTGYRGGWGTTYGSNLRITVKDMTEDQWVAYAKVMRTRPPMPWFTLNQTSEEDLRAMFHFLKSLQPAGVPAPAALAPGQESGGPVLVYPVRPPAPKQ